MSIEILSHLGYLKFGQKASQILGLPSTEENFSRCMYLEVIALSLWAALLSVQGANCGLGMVWWCTISH